MTEWLHALALRFRSALNRKRLEQDLDDELAFHLALKAEKARAKGLDETEARDAARRTFGNPTAAREQLRDAWTFTLLEGLFQDARHATRSLSRTPLFTAVAVLSLAVGIGANTAIFTVLNTMFLRSLPVRDPQQLRILNWQGKPAELVQSHSGYGSSDGTNNTSSSFSGEAFREIEKLNTVFTSAGGFAPHRVNVVARSQAQITSAMLVSGRYFETLQTPVAAGRLLLPSDDSLEAPPAAVISWRLWQRLFAGDASALGSPLRVDKTTYVVVGILPPEFTGLSPASAADLYVPLARAEEIEPYYHLNEPTNWWIQKVGRVAPGVTDAQVQAALDVTLQRIATARTANSGKLAEMRSLILNGRTGLAFLSRDVQGFLLMLLGMVGLVLLIACSNLATLLLARGSARARELAIRRSLGAGRLRVIRYLLTESMLLSGAGALAGLLLAYLGSTLLARVVVQDPDAILNVSPDAAVLAFTCGLALVTALLFGVLPAMRATAHVQPASFLKQAGAGTGNVRQRIARVLVTVQLALSVVLVVGAGLASRTLLNLARTDLGFRRDHLLLFYLEPKRSGYTEERLAGFYHRLQDKVAAIPGVQSVSLTRTPLLAGYMSNRGITIAGSTTRRDRNMYLHVVSERYLTRMGIPILVGRDFESSDNESAPKVAVINATAARRYFDGNPVGREFSFRAPDDKPIRIVGVAGDVKYDSMRRDVPPTLYLPWMQNVESAGGMNFQLRTSVDPLSITAAIRRTVAEMDPTLPLAEVRTQDQLIDKATSKERTFAWLAGFFGAMAVALACIGIYGVLAYAVTRRTSEFGVRMALGATSGQIRWLVMRGTLLLVAGGIAIGIPTALAVTKLIQSRLFGVRPNDGLTLALAVLAIATAALLAAWIPSHKAARSDPASALKYE